jgi:flagella basal body P-ring formation protein FlgA
MSLRHRAVRSFLAVAAFVATAGSASAATVALAGSNLPPTQTVSAVRLAAVADRIAKGLITDPDRTVLPAYALSSQDVPLGAVAIAAQPALVNPSYIAVPLQITVDGRAVRSIVAGYRIQQYVKTAVAARDLAPGAILTADDLTLARLPYTGRPGQDIASLLGRKLRAAAYHGAPVYSEQTGVNEIVHAGSGVILVVHDGPVSLTADVVARTGGGLGDSVTVYNAKTNKILSGTVTGPDRVELQLPEAN